MGARCDRCRHLGDRIGLLSLPSLLSSILLYGSRSQAQQRCRAIDEPVETGEGRGRELVAGSGLAREGIGSGRRMSLYDREAGAVEVDKEMREAEGGSPMLCHSRA